MNEYTIYKGMEFIIFTLYLVLIFLSAQMVFIWIDVDKNKLKSKIFDNLSFLRTNIFIVFSVSVFFMIHEFFEETNLRNSYIYFEFLELLGFICILLFMFNWYSILKTCAHKKPAHVTLLEACINHKVIIEHDSPSYGIYISKLTTVMILGFISLILAFFIPISMIFYALILCFLFVPPILVMASTLIGAFIISKELRPGRT